MQELVIEPGKTELHYWRDLSRFRELLYFLSRRYILVRYKEYWTIAIRNARRICSARAMVWNAPEVPQTSAPAPALGSDSTG
jgi:hypothetical protein